MMSSIIWFTGQPGSGKTTIAINLIKKLNANNISNVMHIDGDDLRDLTSNKDYSKKGRIKNIELAQKIALFCANKGFHVIVSLVAPFKEVRDKFKNKNNVVEFYLQTTDIRGKENFFSDDYVPPTDNFIEIDTGKNNLDESVDIVMNNVDFK